MGKFRHLVLVLLLAMLAACSSNRLVQTYPGERLPNESLATLQVPDSIAMISVNGERVPDYLLSNISVKYGLKPGPNKLVFQYESVWAKARSGQDSERSEAVVSKPREIDVTVKAGQVLSFKYASVENVRDARALAETFEAELVNKLGRVVARSHDVTEEKTQLAAGNTGTTVSNGSATDGLPALEAVKVLWKDLSQEDKKEFLRWAFQ